MNNNNNKNKKVPDVKILESFLAKNSFTNKEESDIWFKFGNIVGTRQYYLNWNKHRADITFQGKKYYYLVKQEQNIKNVMFTFHKLADQGTTEVEIIYNSPENYWNNSIIWVNEKGWVHKDELPKPIQMNQEEEAISIVESILMSSYKNHIKNMDNLSLSKSYNWFLEKTDFCYEYYRKDSKWHAFYPNLKKMISYAEKYNKQDFLNFLNSDDCLWHRTFFGLT